MRALTRTALVSVGLGLATALGIPDVLAADIGVVVLKEHAVGSTTQAQPALDQLRGITAKENGWSGAHGKFFTERGQAQAWIDSDKPHYGILSLAAFLAFRQQYGLDPVGQAFVAGGGGEQYFVVSKAAGSIDVCKGKRLSTDHADDARFIDKVVFNGAAKLADFTVDKQTRVGQPGRKVIGDEAECALIDDAQLATLAKIDGGSAVHPVWSSAKLPAMVIAAFGGVPAAEKTAFQASLPKLCQGAGQQICANTLLQSLQSKSPAEFAGVIALY